MIDKKLVLPICTSFFLLSTILGVHMLGSAFGIEEITEPVYVEIADYYDNRRAVVTVTADDWTANEWQQSEAMGQMLTAKRIHYTGAIITNNANWTHIQYWLNQGYAEAASHSRTHPGNVPYDNYDSEIGGSKRDIIDNLTLPPNFTFGGTEYVYTWSEPYGKSDSTIRQKLGEYKYLADRRVRIDDGWATWNSANGLFDRIGFSIRMESSEHNGVDDISVLNNKFDSVYSAGQIYHVMTHPRNVNWEPGQYADVHTSYISNRNDIWYVNFGLLYLYHWVDTQNVVEVTSTGSLQDKVFKITMSSTDHQNYGAKYPVTYIFDIPPSWTDPYVNYRFRETDAWTTMEPRTSSDFFNGIDAVRFDFSNHKAYISIGFDDTSNEIYLQILEVVKPDFLANPTSGPEPLTASFTDTSIPYDRIVSWSWDFGDGQTSNQENPTHTYTQDGTYTVNLTVYEGDGDSAMKTKEACITVTDTSPSANFAASQTSGLEPITVSFTDTSTSYDGIMSWEWSFGDGETSTEQNPIHTYASAGLYTVSLTVLEADGDHSAETKSGYIVVGDSVPNASFTYSPPNPLEGDLVTFDASGSTGYDRPLSYSWDFGDGDFGEGVSPPHTYAQDGGYLVTLTVADANGSTDSIVHTIAVADKDPMPDFNASPTSEALTVGFTHTSTSYDELVSWAWDFGDGKTSGKQNPTHKFPYDGTFTVSLTVTDADGSTGTITKQVSVMNTPPTADFDIVSSQKPTVDEDITFLDRSSDPDGPDEIVSWFWDLGDGTTYTTQNVTHRYDKLGTFIVSLTVTDDDGEIDTISKGVTIYDVVPPVTVDDYDGLWHTSDFTITLTALDDLSGVAETFYRINGGPTKTVSSDGHPRITTESANNTLEYWSVDNAGNEEAHQIVPNIKLDKTSPTANAGPDQAVDEDTPMTFDGSASNDNIVITNYTWTFFDEAPRTSTGMNPTYAFNTPGVYPVTLTVTDAALNSATDIVVITVIDITKPTADAGDDQVVHAGVTVTFDGSGSADNVGIVSYVWTFIDVSPRILLGVNSTYVFDIPGVNNVTLAVSDAQGNLATDVVTITVIDATWPAADAGPDQVVDEDTLVSFDGSASWDNVGIVSYVWTFVDRTLQTMFGVNPSYTFETPGVYEVTLNVSDAEAHFTTDTVIITVRDITPPLVNTNNYATVVENTPVSFNASGSFDNVAIVNYQWDFGDGTSENSPTPLTIHTYTKPGVYMVTLTVVDEVGNVNGTSISVVVHRDTDGDLLADHIDADDDNDGMPDDWEILHGLDPLDPSDATLDPDGDGFTNLTEHQIGSDPNAYTSPSPFPLLVVLVIAIVGLIISLVVFLIRKF